MQNGVTSKHCDLIYLCTSKKESLHKPYFIATTQLGVESECNPSTNEQLLISECNIHCSTNTESPATRNSGSTVMSKEGPAKKHMDVLTHTPKFHPQIFLYVQSIQ